MGREIKRVPLDFEWPMNKIWKGYINPYCDLPVPCEACGGDGSSKDAKHLHDLWYGYVHFKPEDRGSVPLTPKDKPVWEFAERNVTRSPEFYVARSFSTKHAIQMEAQRLCDLWNAAWSHHLNQDDVDALVAAGRLMDFTHSWTREGGWVAKDPPYHPTAKEVNVWAIGGGMLGHDSINCWAVIGAELKRLGLDGTCSLCKGEGSFWPCERDKQNYENWERGEPPKGEGYQLWETVTEGSPISPVFATPAELATWRGYSWESVGSF